MIMIKIVILIYQFVKDRNIDEINAKFTDTGHVAELPQGHRVRGGEGDGEEELHHGDRVLPVCKKEIASPTEDDTKEQDVLNMKHCKNLSQLMRCHFCWNPGLNVVCENQGGVFSKP